MNHIYKVVFNKATGTFVAVAEFAKAKGKSSSVTVNTTSVIKSLSMPVSFALTIIMANMMAASPAFAAICTATQTNGSGQVVTGTQNATGASDTSLACGINANAESAWSVATGTNARALGGGSTVTGYVAVASKDSTAIGAWASAGYNPTRNTSNGQITNLGTQTGNQSVALGYKALASGDQAMAIGGDTVASGSASVAIGGDDLDIVSRYNVANGTIAGGTATSTSTNVNTGTLNTQFKEISGRDLVQLNGGRIVYTPTTASGQGSVAVGVQSTSAGHLSTAFGTSSTASGLAATALGVASSASGKGALAAAPGAKAEGETSIALGAVAKATATNSVAISEQAQATGENAIAIGTGAQATATNTISIGTGNVVSGQNSGAIGDPTTITGTGSYSLGNDNTINTNDTFVVGSNVTQTLANSVALGKDSTMLASGNKTAGTGTVGSVVVGTTTYGGFAATTPAGVVSVGADGKERRIQNVAAGAITANSTDAINGSQLYSTLVNTQNYFHVNPATTATTVSGDTRNKDTVGGVGNATGGEALAAGVNVIASGRSSVAVGNGAQADSLANIAIGENAKALTEDKNTNPANKDASSGVNKAIAIGSGAQATQAKTIAVGDRATASGRNANAIGSQTTVSGNESTGIGVAATVSGDFTTGIGQRVQALGQQSTAVGTQALTFGDRSTAIGRSATAVGTRATALSSDSVAVAGHTVAVGAYTRASAENAVAIGRGANANAENASSIGRSATALGTSSIAIGEYSLAGNAAARTAYNAAYAAKEKEIYDAAFAAASGDNNAKVAAGNAAKAARQSEIIAAAKAAADTVTADSTKTGQNAIAIGNGAIAEYKDNVVIGAGSVETSATVTNPASLGQVNNAIVNGVTYGGFAATSPSSVVSIGKQGAERRLINVAAGDISGTSTDAINGSQLYSVITESHWKLQANGSEVGDVNFGDKVNFKSTDGSVTITPTAEASGVSTLDLTIKRGLGIALDSNGVLSVANTKLDQNADTMRFATPNKQENSFVKADDLARHLNNTGFRLSGEPQGGTFEDLTTNVGDKQIRNGDTLTMIAGPNMKINQVRQGYEFSVDSKEVTYANNKATEITNPADDGMATVGSVAKAINNSGFTLKTSAAIGGQKLGGSEEVINPADTVDMTAGKNLTVKQDSNGKITYATKDNVEFTSVKAGPVTINNSGIDAGNQPITNVQSGGDIGTNAANIDDVKNARTVVTSNDGSVTIGHSEDGLTNTYDLSVNVNVPTTTLTTNKGVVNTPTEPDSYVTAGDLATTINTAVKSAKEKVEAGTNIASVTSQVDDTTGATTYTVNAKGATVSGSDKVKVTPTNKDGNITDYTVDLSDDTKDQIAKEESVAAGNANITVAKDGTNATGGDNYKVTLSNNLDLGNTGSVTMGDTLLNNNGLTITGGPSVTKTGINAGNKVISNVANGTNPNDAVNVSQLNAVKTEVKGTGLATVAAPTKGENGQDIYTVDVAKADTPTVARGSVTVADADKDKVMTAGDVANAITGSEKTSSVVAAAGSAVTVTAGNEDNNGNTEYTVDLTQATKDQIAKEESVAAGNANITVAKDGTNATGGDNYKVTLSNNLDLGNTGSVTMGDTLLNNNGLTITGGPSVTKTGINAGNKVISNVANGTNPNDAVNVSQLNAVKTEVKGTGLATVAAPTKGENGQDIYTVDVAKADTPTVARGSVTVADADKDKVMTAGDVANAITGSEKTSSVVAAAGSAVTVTAGNEDNNGNTEYTVDLTQATKDQIAKEESVAAGNANITVAKDGTNATGGDNYKVTLSNNLDLGNTGSVTMGDTLLNNNGLTITGGPSVTKTGINAGNKVISNVANGTNPNDAVNVSQLNAVKTEVKGTGLATVAAPTKGENGQDIYTVDVAKADTPTVARGSVTVADADKDKVMTAGDVANAITGSEKTSSVVAAAGSAVTVTAGNEDNNGNTEYTVDLTQATKDQIAKEESVAAGNANITVAKDGTNATGGDNYKVTLSNNLDLGNTGSVTMGDTLLNNNGLTITGGPSVTKTGINAGNKVISNVANGTNPNDAVNVSQLNAVKTEVKGTGLATVAAPTKGENGQDIYTVDVAKADTPTVARGSVTVADADKDKVMTAGDVANAITGSEKTSSVVAAAGSAVTVTAGNEDNNGNTEYTVDLTQATKDQIAKEESVAAGNANITVAKDGTNATGGDNYKVTLSNNLDLGNTGSVTMGDTLLNNNGLTITGGPSVTKTGINAGNKVISNVANGTNPNDAVNVSQLNAVKTEVKGTGLATVAAPTKGENGQDIYTVDVAKADTPTVARGSVTVADADKDKVMTAGDVANAITGSEKTSSVVAAAGSAVTVTAGNEDNNGNTEYTVDLTQATKDQIAKEESVAAGNANITVAKDGTNATGGDNYKVTLSNNLDLGNTGSVTMGDTLLNNNGLTITGGPSVTKTGINAGNKVISNVANGTNPNDAVNVSQLNAVKTEVKGTGLATVAAPTKGENGQDIYTVDVAKADTPTVARGSVTVADADKDKVMTAGDVANAITGSEKTSSVVAAAGSAVTVTAGNEDNNGNTEYTVDLTQATKDQIAKEESVAAGNANITVAKDGTNATGGDNYKVTLSNNLDLGNTGSVTMGDTLLNNNGLTITGGPSVTKTGINAGNKVISNVANGTNPNDAVNVSQLNAVKTEVKGTGLATVAAPTKGENGQDIYTVDVAKADTPTVARGSVTVADADKDKVMTAGDVANAITGSEKTSSVVAAAGSAVTVTAGNEDNNGNTEYTVDLTQATKDQIAKEESVAAGNANITVAKDGTNATGGDNYKVTLSNNLDLGNTGSVTMGDTLLNNNGLTITNGPSVTKTGINAGGKVITNVGVGVNDTDAVNVSQLKKFVAGSKTEVTGTGLANVTSKTGDNGQTLYTVDVAKADAPTVARGSVTVKAGDEGKVMTAGDVAKAITDSERTSSVKAGSGAITVKAGTEDAKGNTEYTVDVATDSSITRDTDGKLSVNTGKITSTDGKASPATGDANKIATVQNVADAINSSGFTLTTSASAGTVSGTTKELINPAETITVDAGKNIAVTQKGNTISVATKDDVSFNNVAIGDNGSLTVGKDAKVDMGGNKITNVANGEQPNDVATVAQLTKVVAGNNIDVTSKKGDNGETIYTVSTKAGSIGGITVNGNKNVTQDAQNTGTGNSFINGQGTKVSVTQQGEIKVDSPMAYTGNQNANDTSTATNTVELVGKDKTKDAVQITKVASGLRQPNENLELGQRLSDADLAERLNLASGETLNNAVNVGDLQGVVANINNNLGQINNRLGDMEDNANAGISSAMAIASIPQAYLPGKSMVAGGMATYNGQGAVAIGVSKLSDNGRWVIKINGSADSKGNAGGAIGAGFHW